MLTIKNGIPLGLAILIAGCTPKGPRELLQGKKLIERGQYDRAIEKLTNAVSIMGTNAQAWNYLGLAYHYAGQGQDAETAYGRALRLDSYLSEARYNRGCLWLEQGKADLARSDLTAFTLSRGNSVDGFLKLGESLLASRDSSSLSAAEKTFQEALRLDHQNADALNGMGLVRSHQRRYTEARQFFTEALKERPAFPAAILNLGILAQSRFQDYPTALGYYRQYLALRPAPTNAPAVLAVAKDLEDRMRPAPIASVSATTTATPSAARTAQTAKTSASNRVEAERMFKKGSDAQKARRLDDAISAYQSAARLDPSYFEANYNLGLAAAAQGNSQLALKAYESALEISPGEARAHLALANLCAQQFHDIGRAREHYLKVLELDPRNPQASEIRRWLAEHPR